MKWNIWNEAEQRWGMGRSVQWESQARDFCETMNVEAGRPVWEVRKVTGLLEQHAAPLMKLKPGMIWRCAMDDLDRRERNLKRSDPSEMEEYAFHRDHVAKSNSANDILRAAIADPVKGRISDKRDTRLLYADVDLLKSALQ
jgi:hypothetical protein